MKNTHFPHNPTHSERPDNTDNSQYQFYQQKGEVERITVFVAVEREEWHVDEVGFVDKEDHLQKLRRFDFLKVRKSYFMLEKTLRRKIGTFEKFLIF